MSAFGSSPFSGRYISIAPETPRVASIVAENASLGDAMAAIGSPRAQSASPARSPSSNARTSPPSSPRIARPSSPGLRNETGSLGDAMAAIGSPRAQSTPAAPSSPRKRIAPVSPSTSDVHKRTRHDSECPVCLEHRNKVVLEPCHHGLCQWCCGRVLSMNQPRCPLCRSEIHDVGMPAVQEARYEPLFPDVIQRLKEQAHRNRRTRRADVVEFDFFAGEEPAEPMRRPRRQERGPFPAREQLAAFDEGVNEIPSDAVPERAPFSSDELRALRPDAYLRLTSDELASARASMDSIFAEYPINEALLWTMPVVYNEIINKQHEGLTDQDRDRFARQLAAQIRTGIGDAFNRRLIPAKWIEGLSDAEAVMYARRVGYPTTSPDAGARRWLRTRVVRDFIPQPEA